MDLRRGDGLGKEQLPVADQDAPGDGDEHDARNPAQHQDHGRDQGVLNPIEGKPDAGDELSRERENRSGGDVVPDGTKERL